MLIYEKIGSFVIFVRNCHKLGYRLENKNDHRPVLNSTKFHANKNSLKTGKFCSSAKKILQSMAKCGD